MAILSSAAFMALLPMCAPDVHPKTMYSIVKTESGFNPYAIGVVGKPLKRQPQSLPEALGVIEELLKANRNFSIGLGQINRYNFDTSKPELVFEPCNNLNMAAQNLSACYAKVKKEGGTEQQMILKAVSCYYSGNPTAGFKLEPQFGNTSHVQRVLASAETYKVGALETSDGESGVPPATQIRQGPDMRAVYQSWDVLRQYPRYEPVQPVQSVGTSDNKAPVSQMQTDMNTEMESINE